MTTRKLTIIGSKKKDKPKPKPPTKTPTYTKKVDVGNFIVDNSKLRKLGWTPKVSVEKGIAKTLDYFNS